MTRGYFTRLHYRIRFNHGEKKVKRHIRNLLKTRDVGYWEHIHAHSFHTDLQYNGATYATRFKKAKENIENKKNVK